MRLWATCTQLSLSIIYIKKKVKDCPFDSVLLQRREISSPLAPPCSQGGVWAPGVGPGCEIKQQLSAFPALDLKTRFRERTRMKKGRGELQAALRELIWGFQPCSLWRESCASLRETAIKADKPKDPD